MFFIVLNSAVDTCFWLVRLHRPNQGTNAEYLKHSFFLNSTGSRCTKSLILKLNKESEIKGSQRLGMKNSIIFTVYPTQMSIKTATLLLVSVFFCHASFGANPERKLRAHRIQENIHIDGLLKEQVWQHAEAATDFIVTEPVPGAEATYKSAVFFLYDDNAVYIGARMFDDEPGKILKELSLRDQIGNADNFRVFFDTYQSGLNGFKFYLTASGVQLEAIVSNHKDDLNWNAIWDSKVTTDSLGWTAEIRIPYSSLRFPSKEVQEWNVQFGREIRRLREVSYWSPIDPAISGWVQQSGKVTHIEKIVTPIRLSLTPYLSTYLNTYNPKVSGQSATSDLAARAGLDLKYGINDAFTLDMTLIPDFGQVISDRQVLNLGPFEVFFAENRQFFTEGTELFSKGNLFYSRRIGGRPLHYFDVYNQLGEGERVTSNPETTQLINATKVSGRTGSGTGLGAFNAVVAESYAEIVNENGSARKIKTNPLTNYNTFVIDQNLKNNSYVTFVNTNVLRMGSDYDANVTGGFFNLKSKSQIYFVSGDAVMSQKYSQEDTDLGYTYHLNAGKNGGNWTYEVGHGLESHNYNPNDMGFLYSPNEWYFYGEGGYTQYTPKMAGLQQYYFNISSTYTRLYKPNVFSDFAINLSSFVLWKSRFAAGIDGRLEPVVTYDYFEPRTPDFSRFLTWPKNWLISGFISSDYRKPIALDIKLSYRDFDAEGRKTIAASMSPRFRFNDKLSVIPSVSLSHLKKDRGYVAPKESIPGLEAGDIFMGVRDRLILENTLTTKFIFNSTIGLNARIRHYWDNVQYNSFATLNDQGELDRLEYRGTGSEGEGLYDRNVNIFNIDMQCNWRFAPGSDLILVWKNQVYATDNSADLRYVSNISKVFESPVENSFSMRVIFYLDYLYLFPRKTKDELRNNII